GKFLSQKGDEVTVIAPGEDLRTQGHIPEVRGKWHADSIISGVRGVRPRCLENFRRSIYHRLLFEVLFSVGAIGLSSRSAARPDVIVAAYPPAVLPGIALMIARLRGIPYIFEVRDLMADALVASQYSRNKMFNRIAKAVENMIYRKADHVITVSDGIKKAILRAGIPESKITPVKNGYEPQIFKNPDRSINPRKDFGWGDRFVVIYAGGLTQSYDIPTLLKAAELTRDDREILYAVIGDGEKKQHYLEYCGQKGLRNVQFYKPRPRKMMPHILAAADVGVHLFPDDPLWDYVLGNKPFDYLGSGLPMIYSGRGDTADLVIKARAGFVVHPERPDELAEKIIWLKSHREKARSMGERGMEYVKTHCDRFVLLKPLDAVIQNLLQIYPAGRTGILRIRNR
ncbi:MAG: glycosyltransferase family 4 protein, partial [Deltaproteobacteria bacterium]|nr:glycosyltransferase family 4 protein [Deltaproteobacteria bacterium]